VRRSQIGAGCAAALLALFLCAAQAGTATRPPAAGELAARRADLDELQQKIKSLQGEIDASETTRHEAADDLAEVEKTISGSQRKLREIGDERRDLEAEQKKLDTERDEVESTLASQRKALGDTLYRYYVFGRKAGARRLIGGDDPNQLARDAYYLEKIAEARRNEIDAARRTLAQREELIAAVQAKKDRIAALEQDQAKTHAGLVEEQKKRSQVLAEIQDKLRAQRKEVATLKQDEGRLSKLIDGLAKLPPPRPVAKPQPKKTQSEPALGMPGNRPTEGAEAPRREAASGVADTVADGSVPDSDFANLRGRLHWPVRGELVGRFGAPRGDGTTQWKGVFIRAGSGEVRAVAPGRVVFADWLRGFGNLIIIDHGDGFMTIYGNNESLFKSPGETVRAGEAIAAVGSSGGGEESGLYFEIRRHGQPQDPAKWVAR